MSKTILISGVTGALGAAAARAFASDGNNLILLDRDADKLQSLLRDLDLPADRVHAEQIDLLDGQAVQTSADAALHKFGSVHALIHLVGGWTGGKPLPETSGADLKFMLDQHVWTTYHLFQAYAPSLAAARGRVLIVSMPVTVQPTAKMGLYAAAKSAQETMAFSLAEDYKNSGLTANVLHVRAIDVKNEGKGTRVSEILSAMQYLLSDEAAKINGARIPLYG